MNKLSDMHSRFNSRIQLNLTNNVTIGQSDLNSEVTVLAGLNVLYFTVMEILWDYPMGDHNIMEVVLLR